MPSPRVRTFTLFILNASWQTSIHRTRACTASFSTTTSALYAASREPTLYEILDVPVTASAAEIKKYDNWPRPTLRPSPPHLPYFSTLGTANVTRISSENSTPSPSITTQTAIQATRKPPPASPASHRPTTSSATAPSAPPTIANTASMPNMAPRRTAPQTQANTRWVATAATAQISIPRAPLMRDPDQPAA